MVNDRTRANPQTFYLNEQHELAHSEKEGGGALPKLAKLDWKEKGRKLHRSLASARDAIERSRDPLRNTRYFLSSTPSAVRKVRKTKLDPAEEFEEATDYAGEHSRTFRRLGLDLLAVDEKGRALVHVPAARLAQMLKTSEGLGEEGPRQQARWVAIDEFEAAPRSFRIDDNWLSRIRGEKPLDAVVEMQPLLTRTEIDQVVQAIIEMLGGRGASERFARTGTDFSGRQWFRGLFSRKSLAQIAQQFFSVQSIHPPLSTEIALAARPPQRGGTRVAAPVPIQVDPALLPTVGVVDVGVPANHRQLAPYCRGTYKGQDVPDGLRVDHGARVASRVVFGDADHWGGITNVVATCRYFDINIAESADRVDDKSIAEAMSAVVATAPDVRIFNMSFGDRDPLGAYDPIQRREKLALVQDLDNLAFRHDVFVVVAAGNSRPGFAPSRPYPEHIDEPEWALGCWARGFNTVKCGAYVGRLSAAGLVTRSNWPSPFTRIGPGLADSPVPDFASNGGNATTAFGFAPGLGVWTLSADGTWEDVPGTSFAAPIVAREAAFAMEELQRRCQQGARPFAATVKAFLAISAEWRLGSAPAGVTALARRTLGRGDASAGRLLRPSADSAVLIWQGVLAGPEDIARIQVPIPRSWREAAESPRIRIVAAWESPVNAAVERVWASRRVEFQLRPRPDEKALFPSGKNHPSYPILDRSFRLDPKALEQRGIIPPEDDLWLLEVSYVEIADYLATLEFSPHQRVGIAIELGDDGAAHVSPQEAMQALPLAMTMTRLTVPENRIANPVIVRARS